MDGRSGSSLRVETAGRGAAALALAAVMLLLPMTARGQAMGQVNLDGAPIAAEGIQISPAAPEKVHTPPPLPPPHRPHRRRRLRLRRRRRRMRAERQRYRRGLLCRRRSGPLRHRLALLQFRKVKCASAGGRSTSSGCGFDTGRGFVTGDAEFGGAGPRGIRTDGAGLGGDECGGAGGGSDGGAGGLGAGLTGKNCGGRAGGAWGSDFD